MTLGTVICSYRENPYSPRRATEIQRGVGPKRRQFPRGGGGPLKSFFFSRAPSKIDEQAVSYFTVNQCFKSKIIVLIHK